MHLQYKGAGKVHLIHHGKVTALTSVFIGNRKFLHVVLKLSWDINIKVCNALKKNLK